MNRRSPTTGLMLGLILTLAAVVVYSRYITSQISDLQDLQSELVDRNRRESLQLIRIQNDLNSVAHAMRDMLDGNEPYPLTAWQTPLDRLRADLEDALRTQEQVAVADQSPQQRDYLRDSIGQFWDAVDRMFAMAREGNEADALTEVRFSLQARQAALSATVARLLVQNNESEEAAAIRIGQVYADVRRQVALFLVATLIAILSTGVFLIRSNRRVFGELATLSDQRSDLARALIASQESTLRHVSRDLHDEFGQVLTAVGSLLDRTRRNAPPDSPIGKDLQEVREIAQSTLDNVRGMSQALHPAILDDGGLESALEWLATTTSRHTGLDLKYEIKGEPFPIGGDCDIHIYRIVQEALTNVARHSGATTAWIRLRFLDDALVAEVEDHGRGFSAQGRDRGIGMIAMRERAELVGGAIGFHRPSTGGTIVRLRVPKKALESSER
jgi:signal transduction histidine kinase